MELKLIVFILFVISALITKASYEEVWVDKRKFLGIEISEGFAPKTRWFVMGYITMMLLIFLIYLNDNPIYI
jgi:hypothetical protein